MKTAKAATASYRLFLAALFCALMFEQGGTQSDPFANLGNDYLADMTSWTGIHIIVNLFEIAVALTAVLWLVTRTSRRGPRIQRTLTWPVVALSAALAIGVVNGLAGGGNLTYALWEVRGFAMLIAAYLLTCALITSEDRVNDLIWVILISSMILAVENTLRWAFFLRTVVSTDDLAYDHVDSVVLVCGVLLCLCLLAFGGTRAQRRFAIVAVPVYVFAMEVMKRRAAFAILAIGVLVFCVFLLRLRPRTFWRIVPPLALLCAIYLIIFWNQNGTLAQPARAISSQFTPDPRDAASNNYRVVEKYDIISNIQRAQLLGLGFGQQYIMYIPLPNLGSVWPFWHYMTHNMILWVWMKDGAIGFVAFWWLLGRGVYDGSRAVATQREEWSLAKKLYGLLARRTEDPRAIDRVTRALERNHYATLRPTVRTVRGGGRKGRGNRAQAVGLNVPTWERSNDRSSLTARESGVLAFLVMAVCMVPVQVVFSYVDLGLSSERDTVLIGLVLAVISQASLILRIEWTPRKRSQGSQDDAAKLEDTRDRIRALVKHGKAATSGQTVVPSTVADARPTSTATARAGATPAQESRERLPAGRGASSHARDGAPLPWETR
jgi:energy-coupling factor transporter transmembrane protein EcfT